MNLSLNGSEEQIDNLIADTEEDIPEFPQNIRLNPDAPWYSERSCRECRTYLRFYLKHIRVAEHSILDARGETIVHQGWVYIECPNCEAAVDLGDVAYSGVVKEYTREAREMFQPW